MINLFVMDGSFFRWLTPKGVTLSLSSSSLTSFHQTLFAPSKEDLLLPVLGEGELLNAFLDKKLLFLTPSFLTLDLFSMFASLISLRSFLFRYQVPFTRQEFFVWRWRGRSVFKAFLKGDAEVVALIDSLKNFSLAYEDASMKRRIDGLLRESSFTILFSSFFEVPSLESILSSLQEDIRSTVGHFVRLHLFEGRPSFVTVHYPHLLMEYKGKQYFFFLRPFVQDELTFASDADPLLARSFLRLFLSFLRNLPSNASL